MDNTLVQDAIFTLVTPPKIIIYQSVFPYFHPRFFLRNNERNFNQLLYPLSLSCWFNLKNIFPSGVAAQEGRGPGCFINSLSCSNFITSLCGSPLMQVNTLSFFTSSRTSMATPGCVEFSQCHQLFLVFPAYLASYTCYEDSTAFPLRIYYFNPIATLSA